MAFTSGAETGDDTEVVRSKEVGRRRPSAHSVYQHDLADPVIVFLTVCVRDRRSLLADPAAHDLCRRAWTQAANGWLVGRYVLMPDHVHLFCAPATLHIETPLAAWIAYWKSLVARAWPRPADAPLWKRHGWDTQLRRQENYSQKWDYVRANPVRAGLCFCPDDWPYQGELTDLRW